MFKTKEEIANKTGNNCTNNVEIMVPSKYLGNFWRTLKISLINCEITLDLNCSQNYFIVANNANQATTFSITDTKLFVPAVTLSTQSNAKLFEQFKSAAFKRTINWNKCQSKISTERQNQYLDYLIDPSFQEVNRLFFLSF